MMPGKRWVPRTCVLIPVVNRYHRVKDMRNRTLTPSERRIFTIWHSLTRDNNIQLGSAGSRGKKLLNDPFRNIINGSLKSINDQDERFRARLQILKQSVTTALDRTSSPDTNDRPNGNSVLISHLRTG